MHIFFYRNIRTHPRLAHRKAVLQLTMTILTAAFDPEMMGTSPAKVKFHPAFHAM